MSILADMGQRIAAAMAPLAGPLTLRVGSTDYPVQGWEEAAVIEAASGLRTAHDRLFNILTAAGLPTPAPGNTLVVGAEVLNVQTVAGDGVGAGGVWRVAVRK